MSFAITVGTSSVNLYDELGATNIEKIRRRSDSKNIAAVLVNNTPWSIVYIGTVGETASAATGLPLPENASISFDENSLRDVNLISDTAATDVRVWFAESEQR